MACEQFTVNATTALLEFPVDPSAPFAAAVESEILLDGLGLEGPSGLNFGVPAAFFYALGATFDKTTKATPRFQMATGDDIERLLQQFATAVDAQVITDQEAFAGQGLGNLKPVSSFQAARRLAALAVPAASATPPVLVLAGSPLAALVGDWLAAADPASTQDPPPSYQSDDFTIWSQQLAVQDPQGYLDLDLDALTQGYVIPPFTASPSAVSGSTLTFGTGTGIGPGMPVSGPGIGPGTTVVQVSANPATTTTPATTTVVLSNSVTGSSTAALTFNDGVPPVTATTTADCPVGTALLTFAGPGGTAGISAGMSAFGPGIAPGTRALSVTPTTVTITPDVTAKVLAGLPLSPSRSSRARWPTRSRRGCLARR